jgi:hypothetical protein
MVWYDNNNDVVVECGESAAAGSDGGFDIYTMDAKEASVDASGRATVQAKRPTPALLVVWHDSPT